MREHKKVYSKDNNPYATFQVGEDKEIVADLFPYKIQNREKFYLRDHPEDLLPESLAWAKYWDEFIINCVEGKWIKDDKGTWVYMMPKLFYYINYVIISDKKRKRIQPHLCDLEWIFFTYFMCLDGFSGFEKDDKYTCNELVHRYEMSKRKDLSKRERDKYYITDIEIENIPDSCKKEDGSFKEYVNPWTYLTRTYLIDDPRGPLGLGLYENQRKNGFILGARGIRKSFTVYLGDFLHEWHFGGITKKEQLPDAKNALLFAMGSGSKQQMQRTINNIRYFYDSQPGRYKYESPDIADYMGPLYKNYQGTFTVGKEFQHIIKGKNNNVELLGSTCQISAITPDRTKITAGDRFRRIYVEEVGFIEYIEEVFAANVDSISLDEEAVGSFIATGTGGDMEAIVGSKNMFSNPEAYNIFPLPNYWKNPRENNIGLFIPAQYKIRKFEDKNGFIYLDLASEEILRKRKLQAQTLDSNAYTKRIQYNPINPDEMLMPSGLSVLPKREAQKRISDIESYGLFKKIANVGELIWNKNYPNGVKFEKDIKEELDAILDWNIDFNKIDRRGAFVMYDPPPENTPDNMYWVIYDPAAKSGEGTSLHSVLVYKHFYSSSGDAFKDNIVAEWIGRLETLNENYEQVLKIAKYYNAKIFPEVNIAGFVEWCKSNNHYNMLQGDNDKLYKEISPKSKRNYYRKGFSTNERSKWWGIQKFNDWLLQTRRVDPESGLPESKNIDAIFSLRLLDEIVNFNESDNFDHISSAIGLMILIDQIERYKPQEEDKMIGDDEFDKYEQLIQTQTINITRRRSPLENF